MMVDQMQRRLAAIIVADVVGYSRLTTLDEEGTIGRINKRMDEIVRPEIEKAGGRFVKHTGDGFIAEFPSVAAAFKCASTIQEQFDVRNAENRKEGVREPLLIRIGLDIGDIITRDGDVFGNGVNIAARLEGLAAPGGICVSQRARDHLTQFEMQFRDLGEQKLKNIAEPVRAFQVTRESPGILYLISHNTLYRRIAIWVAVLAVAGIATIGYLLWYPRGVSDPEEFLTARLGELQCSWLRINEFSESEAGVELAIVGASVTPGSSVERALRQYAQANGVPISRISVSGIAPMESTQCELIEGLRRYQHTGIRRLEADETTVGTDTDIRFTLVFDPDELHEYAHIYSIDPDGSMILAENREQLVERAERLADGRYAVDYLSDHIGWGGIMLMESDGPIDNELVLSLADSQERIPAFEESAQQDNWRFELLWLNSERDDADES
ncbi:MAG: adenylate/guanylate cyclase domain-containing protein [Parasphingopyxis sp.]